MFRTILIGAMFITAAGYCFAAQNLPQVVTSEVFYKESKTAVPETVYENIYDTQVYENNPTTMISNNCLDEICANRAAPVIAPAPIQYQEVEYVEVMPAAPVPVWPISGSDADVQISGSATAAARYPDENIRIVSKIGADLVVENNFNLGTRGGNSNWSGGANMLHGSQVPAGFDNCEDGSEMPLLHREMMEDDGGGILSVARSNRKRCGGRYVESTLASVVVEDNGTLADGSSENSDSNSNGISVDYSADAQAPIDLKDQVRSWVVASGQSLREVLQTWCDKEGWDLVWATAREYPIEASAVFKGRFVDVSSALVRNFGRAVPIPYAKFYKGNRVLVISTTEE